MKIFQLSFRFLTRNIGKKEPKKEVTHRSSCNKISFHDQKLHFIWCYLIDTYFPTRTELKDYKVVWSGRKQTRCLASCNIDKKIVRVAPAMKLHESQRYLEPLLYHELCHAVVGIKVIRGRRRMHTSEFKLLEKQHPLIHELEKWIESGGWTRSVRRAHTKNVFPESLFF